MTIESSVPPRAKRKRSSISSSSSESQMASAVPKAESDSSWDAGSLILSRESTGPADTTSAASTSNVSAAQLPELPKLTGDLVLETFTHRSLRRVGSTVLDSFPDNERLSEVGEMALNLAVTNYLYHKHPTIEANAMPAERCSILSDENYETWIKYYDIQKQLRHTSADINAIQEIRTLFNAYVGAVYEELGMRAVGTWISRLIDPVHLPVNPDDTGATSLPSQKDAFRQDKQMNHRKIKRQKSEVAANVSAVTDSSENNGASADLHNTPPPPLPPPIVGSGLGVYSSPPVNYLPAVQMPLPTYGPLPSGSPTKEIHYLPKFNERCSQQKLGVEYKAENLGSPHAPKWVMMCMVNGIHKGSGQGSSKQVAKEEAAKQASMSMGWVI